MRLRHDRPGELVCREAVELVTEYLEGMLPPAERERFEAHLAECPGCCDYLAQMRATIALLGRVEPQALSGDACAALVDLYRRWREI